jgi:hypothetical protein
MGVIMGYVTDYNAMVRAAAAAGEPLTVPKAIEKWSQGPNGGLEETLLPGGIGMISQGDVALPSVSALAPAAATALAGAGGVLGTVGTVAGLGLSIYGLLQALGLGEGGGLFDNNLLGGDEFEMGGVEFGGPGLAEPLEPYTERHVDINGGRLQYYYMPQYTKTGKYAGMKIAMYNTVTKKWKVWRLPKPSLAIIGKNMPRHQMLTRLRKNLSRHRTDAKTILKFTSPKDYMTLTGHTVIKRSYRGRRR